MSTKIITTASSAIFSKIQDLDESNWFHWSKQMSMFFVGCNVPNIMTGALPTNPGELADFNATNTMLTAYIYAKVAPQYQYLVEDERTATAAWTKLKAHFEKSTMAHRMVARQSFYTIKHDPDMTISAYIQAVTAARARLQAFGCTVTDTEFIDVLLMNLSESHGTIRTTILAQKEEPDLNTVKAMLMDGSSDMVEVKIEHPGDAALVGIQAYRASIRTRNRSSRFRHTAPGPPANPVDEKGHRWCDATNSNACHRCGRTGHIAANCMYDMPQSVKDWLMGRSSPSASRSRSPPYKAHLAANFYHPSDSIDPYAKSDFHEPEEYAF